MIKLNSQNQGFSSIYKTRIRNKIKIYKIYNDIAFSKFQRINNLNSINFFQNLNNLKISPQHKVLSKHIIEMDSINQDYQLTKKIFFNNKFLQRKLKNKLQKLNRLNLKLVNKSLSMEISSYSSLIKKIISSKKKFNQLIDYIESYSQNKICHGDLHFSNMLVSDEKLYLLDWDYRIKSSFGYELAMFSYIEKFNKNEIDDVSKVFKVSIKEINHYIPICMILDFIYQNILIENKKILKIDNNLKKNVHRFIEDIL
tara:strand:- start:5452 stop:6219 length:768 start_codon:yes stop_codon:yes gene_type:complete